MCVSVGAAEGFPRWGITFVIFKRNCSNSGKARKPDGCHGPDGGHGMEKKQNPSEWVEIADRS